MFSVQKSLMDSGFNFNDALSIKQDRQEKMWKALEGVRSSIMSTIRQHAMVNKDSECFVYIPIEMPNFPEYNIGIIALSMKKFLVEQGFTVELDKNDKTRLKVNWKNPTGEATTANTALKLAIPLDHPHMLVAKRILSELMALIRESCYVGTYQCYYHISPNDYESPNDLERLVRWLYRRSKKRGFVLQRTQDTSVLYWSMDAN